MLAGRGITGRDLDGAPRVMVINQALAARLAEVAGMKDLSAKIGSRIVSRATWRRGSSCRRWRSSA